MASHRKPTLKLYSYLKKRWKDVADAIRSKTPFSFQCHTYVCLILFLNA